jgi:hypothetical protein
VRSADRTNVIVTKPVVSQEGNGAVQFVLWYVSSEKLLLTYRFTVKNTPIYILYASFVTATLLLLLKNFGNDPRRQSQTDTCSECKTRCWSSVKYNEIQRKMKTLAPLHREVHTLVHEEFLPSSMYRAREPGGRYGQNAFIFVTCSEFSIPNLRTWVVGWNLAVGIKLTPIRFVTFCIRKGPILPAMETTKQETPIYGILIIW